MGYHGFDIMNYPGDNAVADFRNGGVFSWVGFYLGGPTYLGRKRPGSHQSSTWTGPAYNHLRRLGYGVTPIYCGLQPAASRGLEKPGAAASSGESDARTAITYARDVGLVAGTAMFLDVEGGNSLPPQMIEYALAWTRHLDQNSPYWGAVYCNLIPARDLRNAGFSGAIWLARWTCSSGRCPTLPNCGPSSCGNPCPPDLAREPHAGFPLQQYAGNVHVRQGGTCLVVDLNVSNAPNPANS
ncbi:MAG: glycoside hydrolase domain-containing protein [Bacillota bacterium]